jgi:hypothetical protein
MLLRGGGGLMPPQRPAAQDFYRLRREGIGHIEQTGSAAWTDYNTHDPGISILEVLAYAITDLGYRTDFPIADILASGAPGDLAFYSARTMLTVNPTTAEDLRRLLIDADRVRNAWVRCDGCPCDASYYAWCEDDELVLGYDPTKRSDPDIAFARVDPRGLYRVLLELEADPEFGDLNDRKVVRRRAVVEPDGRRHVVTIEVRFPEWAAARRDERRRLADAVGPLGVAVAGPNRTPTGTTPVTDAELRTHWFDAFYVDFAIELADHTTIVIENAALRVFGDGAARRQATVAQLLAWLGDETPEGFAAPYGRKLAATDAAITSARAVLDAHRNLDEDFCRVDLVDVEEIAVCADVQVEATADIDLVQARIWYAIERYLDPPLAFATLDELRARGVPTDAVFNGPELTSGFLTEQALRDTDLRTELRVSDILNLLIDIDGVISVDNLLLTGYDALGVPIKGAADPDWTDGTPRLDPSRISASWLLLLRPDRRPRLHRGLSRFLFSAGGLPFLARLDEAEDTLVQLHGQAARPKISATDLDLAVPVGRRRRLAAYQPVQHSFPLTYGIGPAGLPSTAIAQRRAQAAQLKAYLMVYEQLLRNAYAQLARAGELFSLDPAIEHTYFTDVFTADDIAGYADVVEPTLTAARLAELVETPTEFLERRNRFLDHLLARFAESFAEYAMLLTDLKGQSRARHALILAKLAFLRALPRVGHDRGKAFDRTAAPCDPDNTSGLQERVHLLLGLPDWRFGYRASASDSPPGFTHALTLDELGRQVMVFTPAPVAAALAGLLTELGLDTAPTAWRIESADGLRALLVTADGRPTTVPLTGPEAGPAAATLGRELAAAKSGILAALVREDRLAVVASGDGWQVMVPDGDGERQFRTRGDAEEFRALIATWAAHRRAIVVEHLLLRPKFPGDALYPACLDGPGCLCGEEDPYSFRLTYVMPGWTEPFSSNLTMRRFADTTIRAQTPAHLLVKICWVGDDGYLPDPCDPVVDELASVLQPHTATQDAACRCAAEVYTAYGAAFAAWFAEHALLRGPADVLTAALTAMFAADVDLSAASCSAVIDAALRAALDAVLVPHFVAITVGGYQFERFEDAWCAWAAADAAIDWTDERLHDAVLDLLARASAEAGHERLCACATALLAEFGTHFRAWMDAQLAAGVPLDQVTGFAPPNLTACAELTLGPAVVASIRDLLVQRYTRYTEVSYRLSVLVRALADLRNTYPRATLHDCDEGSDFNPVRLGQTALGSN